jgi:hypothetical protein
MQVVDLYLQSLIAAGFESDLTAFSVPVDLRELTPTRYADPEIRNKLWSFHAALSSSAATPKVVASRPVGHRGNRPRAVPVEVLI